LEGICPIEDITVCKRIQSMPLRSSASKACATDKQVERKMMVCNRFRSFGACCAIFSKEALRSISKQALSA